MKKLSHLRGFTLIELLVAISIIVVLMAFLIPGLRFISDSNRVSEASRLVSGSFHKAASRSKSGAEKIASSTNDTGNTTEDYFLASSCLVFDRNLNFTQAGNAFGCTSVKLGRFQKNITTETVNRELRRVPKAMWNKFVPPITEQLPIGTEVFYGDQASELDGFIRSL